MKRLIILSILVFFSVSYFGQKAQVKTCSAGRFEQDIFPTATKKTVQYASNTDWNGEKVTLSMDIFMPDNDTATNRPLVIFAHGGGYVQGSKEDMEYSCKDFAKKGFITATIQYRLIPLDKIYDSQNMLHEIVKAMSDMKAAIRYFRESIANGNPYKIDGNFIFVGGASAGAITALHVGVLDVDDVLPVDFKRFIDEDGGFEGNTKTAENKQFSTKIRGIINYSGGLYKEEWLDKGDPPIFSYTQQRISLR